jgi:AraC-like DNA-binding protein
MRGDKMEQRQLHSLCFRSYGIEGRPHSHDHIQIVLPVRGKLEIETEGRGGRIDLSCGIIITPGIRHSQAAEDLNRFLILDCAVSVMSDEKIERFSRNALLSISPAVRRLIQFIDLSSHAGEIDSSISRYSGPLLLNALLDAPARGASRLSTLLRHVEHFAGENWSVLRMAQLCGLSPSRLHELFQSELQTTPQNWLSETRLHRAQELLANSSLPISQIALQVGYSDQTALTRAMRRISEMTPAVYRRLHRQ